MGFFKAIGVAESVDDAADIEGVRPEAAAAELLEEAEGGVGVAVDGAELVDASCPMCCVGNSDDFKFVGFCCWDL